VCPVPGSASLGAGHTDPVVAAFAWVAEWARRRWLWARRRRL